MKVFGIGLSRTGTTTLSTVLKPHLNIVHYPNNMQLYSDANDGACDIPVIPEYKKLFKVYKNAKFILTVRNIDEWVASIVPYFERKRTWQMGAQQKLRESIYGSPFPNEKQARNAYKRHYDDVMKFFDGKDSMLELDIIGGDKPKKLFDFLGLKNPPKEFPITNKLKKE